MSGTHQTRGRTKDSGMTTLSHELYPNLGPKQRAFLGGERRPSRRAAAGLGPYPVTSETAAVVEALDRHFVLPWSLVRERHLALWLRDTLIADGARDVPLITPIGLHDKMRVFRHIDE